MKLLLVLASMTIITVSARHNNAYIRFLKTYGCMGRQGTEWVWADNNKNK